MTDAPPTADGNNGARARPSVSRSGGRFWRGHPPSILCCCRPCDQKVAVQTTHRGCALERLRQRPPTLPCCVRPPHSLHRRRRIAGGRTSIPDSGCRSPGDRRYRDALLLRRRPRDRCLRASRRPWAHPNRRRRAGSITSSTLTIPNDVAFRRCGASVPAAASPCGDRRDCARMKIARLLLWLRSRFIQRAQRQDVYVAASGQVREGGRDRGGHTSLRRIQPLAERRICAQASSSPTRRSQYIRQVTLVSARRWKCGHQRGHIGHRVVHHAMSEVVGSGGWRTDSLDAAAWSISHIHDGAPGFMEHCLLVTSRARRAGDQHRADEQVGAGGRR